MIFKKPEGKEIVEILSGHFVAAVGVLESLLPTIVNRRVCEDFLFYFLHRFGKGAKVHKEGTGKPHSWTAAPPRITPHHRIIPLISASSAATGKRKQPPGQFVAKERPTERDGGRSKKGQKKSKTLFFTVSLRNIS